MTFKLDRNYCSDFVVLPSFDRFADQEWSIMKLQIFLQFIDKLVRRIDGDFESLSVVKVPKVWVLNRAANGLAVF